MNFLGASQCGCGCVCVQNTVLNMFVYICLNSSNMSSIMLHFLLADQKRQRQSKTCLTHTHTHLEPQTHTTLHVQEVKYRQKSCTQIQQHNKIDLIENQQIVCTEKAGTQAKNLKQAHTRRSKHKLLKSTHSHPYMHHTHTHTHTHQGPPSPPAELQIRPGFHLRVQHQPVTSAHVKNHHHHTAAQANTDPKQETGYVG